MDDSSHIDGFYLCGPSIYIDRQALNSKESIVNDDQDISEAGGTCNGCSLRFAYDKPEKVELGRNTMLSHERDHHQPR